MEATPILAVVRIFSLPPSISKRLMKRVEERVAKPLIVWKDREREDETIVATRSFRVLLFAYRVRNSHDRGVKANDISRGCRPASTCRDQRQGEVRRSKTPIRGVWVFPEISRIRP